MITKEQLKTIMPFGKTRIDVYYDYLIEAMREFEINTRLRCAAFIAQLAHESGSFRYVQELANGKAYEGRHDLGNNQPGDGMKFKGRGLIQVTGRNNYSQVSKALGMDFISSPGLLEQPQFATRSAAWFWNSRNLNEIADKGDFKLITKVINGGYNGFAEREAFYKKALEVIK
jgi:putative chitinase